MDISSLLNSENIITTTVNNEIESLTFESLDLWNEALANIKIVRQARTCITASSFGKDSNLLIALNLQAHIELIKEMKIDANTPFFLVTIDTDVESIFTQLTINHHIDALKKFSIENEINLQLICKKPPVDKRYASLFFSGLKYYSVSRTSNDCSEILKVDTASLAIKELIKNINFSLSDHCMMLGTRHSESANRSSKMKRRVNTAVEVAEYQFHSTKEKKRLSTFEPIANFSDSNVWFILQHSSCSNQPLYNSPLIKPFPTYIDNFSVLRLMYELSGVKSDTCPDAAAMLQGSASAGSCGSSKSARQGCYLCLKSLVDKSSNEAQKNTDFYSHLIGDTNLFRNWLLSEAADIDKRVFYSRAIDKTTGYVSMSANVMNAEHFVKAIAHASILTITDQVRAKHLRYLIDSDQIEKDRGYQLIINDEKLSAADKETLLKLYITQATKPLISMMNDKIALFISFIHSRDGVKIAPWAAYNIWKMAESCLTNAEYEIEDFGFDDNDSSKYLSMLDLPELFEQQKIKLFKSEPEIFGEIPVVDVTKIKFDDVPDIRMIKIPNNQSLRIPYLDSLDLDRVRCDYTRNICSVDLTTNEANVIGTDLKLQYCEDVGKIDLYSPHLKKKACLVYASQRKIIRKKEKKKISISRGRSRTNSMSFKLRTDIPAITSTFKPLRLFIPSTTSIETMDIITTNENLNTRMVFNEDQLSEYFYNSQRPVKETLYVNKFYSCNRTDGYEDTIILKFRDWRKCYGLYHSAGTAAYKALLSWDFISLSKRARNNQDFIINRNELFKAIGIHNASNQELLDNSISINEHRTIKAKILLNIRERKNVNRNYYKSEVLLYNEDIEKYTINQITQRLDFGLHHFKNIITDLNLSSHLLNKGIGYFDGMNISNFFQTIKNWIQLFVLISVDDLILLHTNHQDRSRLNTAKFRQFITVLVNSYRKLFNMIIESSLSETNEALKTNSTLDSFSIFFVLAKYNGITEVRNVLQPLENINHAISLKSNLIEALESSELF